MPESESKSAENNEKITNFIDSLKIPKQRQKKSDYTQETLKKYLELAKKTASKFNLTDYLSVLA